MGRGKERGRLDGVEVIHRISIIYPIWPLSIVASRPSKALFSKNAPPQKTLPL